MADTSSEPNPRTSAAVAPLDDVELLRAIFAASTEAILVADDERRWVAANPAACVLLGKERGEIVGMKVDEIVHPKLRPLVNPAWERLFAEGAQSGAMEIHRQDGTVRHTFYHAHASIRPGLHLVFFRDQTDHVITERALRQSEREFRAMVDASPDMVFRTNIRGVFEYMSPAATTILGWEPSDLVGTASRAIIHPDDFEAAAEGFGQALAGQANSFRVRVRRKDGSYTWTETRRSLLGTPEKPLGIVTIVREIEMPIEP